MRTLIILSIIIFAFYSCKTDRKLRTIYWSGFRIENNFRDTVFKPELHIIYYIEISDNGDAKIMLRKNFKAPKKYYKIKISDSLINHIFRIASNDSLFSIEDLNANLETPIYDGPSYCIQYQNDSIKKGTVYEPYRSNPTQGKIQKIMKEILKKPNIIETLTFDLTEYEKQIDSLLKKCNFYPPIIKESISFTQP